MSKPLPFLVLSGILAASGATAQTAQAPASPAPQAPAAPGTYISEVSQQGVIDSVPTAADGTPGAFSKRLFSASTYSASLIRLTSPDMAHVHGSWSEVYIIKAGSGVVETGGVVTGVTSGNSAVHKSLFLDAPQASAKDEPAGPDGASAHRASGDLAGTGIDGGTQQAVGPGDLVLIPAGTPHRWLSISGSVVYLDVKFPRAQ